MNTQTRKHINKKVFGFKINEVMTGYHHFEPGLGSQGKLFMEFKGNWGPDNILNWINPKQGTFLTQPLKGTVTIEGLCKNQPMKGTLALKYFKDATICYQFEFKVKNKIYQYTGEKVNIKPWNLLVSHTTCFGRVIEKKTGKLVSTSVVYFNLKTIPKFLLSARLTSHTR